MMPRSMGAPLALPPPYSEFFLNTWHVVRKRGLSGVIRHLNLGSDPQRSHHASWYYFECQFTILAVDTRPPISRCLRGIRTLCFRIPRLQLLRDPIVWRQVFEGWHFVYLFALATFSQGAINLHNTASASLDLSAVHFRRVEPHAHRSRLIRLATTLVLAIGDTLVVCPSAGFPIGKN